MTTEEYPQVHVPLRKLRYRWNHPRERIHGSVLTHYLGYEAKLRDDLHALVSARNPLGMLYVSIKEEGLLNPLIVKQGDEEPTPLYYVVIGNQRLAVLRAMEHHAHRRWEDSEKLIPCLVAKPEDDWTDSTRARHVGSIRAMGFNPYRKEWVLDPPTDGWRRDRDG